MRKYQILNNLNCFFMKKSLLLLLLVSFVITEVSAIPNKMQYRWRNDDGDEASATWSNAVNTPIEVISTIPSLRLRLEFENDNNTPVDLSSTLVYSADGGNTWVAVTNDTTHAFTLSNSSYVTNGSATTNQLGNTSTSVFMPGYIISGTMADVSVTNARIEHEWVIRPTVASLEGITYLFKYQNVSSSLQLARLSVLKQCHGIPTAGQINATSNLVFCNTTTSLSLLGTSKSLGVSYQWQYLENGSWINQGANSDTITSIPVIQQVQYRCIVRCIEGDSSVTAEFTINANKLPIHLSDEINPCINEGSSYALDAGINQTSAMQYLWNDGTSGKIKNIDQSGTYSVMMTDSVGCKGYDTITVNIHYNPQFDLGRDTTICDGASIALNIENTGASYGWSTGENTSSITVSTTGTYFASLTDAAGCVGIDSIKVKVSGSAPDIDGISVSNNGQFTFKYAPINPTDVVRYEWNFGDGSPISTLESPEHTFADGGNYLVTLTMRNACGSKQDSTASHVLSVNDVNLNDVGFVLYPNPATNNITIAHNSDVKMEKIEMFNIVGQLLLSQKVQNTHTHTIQIQDIANGIYTVTIYTDKGVVTRKIQVLN
jgi:hypothetical protein